VIPPSTVHVCMVILILLFLGIVLAKRLLKIHVNIDENSKSLLLLSGLSHGCCSIGRLQFAKHRLEVKQLLMTKKVALQYSWSGLGLNRQRKKKALRNHRLVVLLESKCRMELSIVLTCCFSILEKVLRKLYCM